MAYKTTAEAIRIDPVKTDEEELARILDEMDSRAKRPGVAERRGSRRIRYRVRSVMVSLCQSGKDVVLAVPTRDISRTGLAFLHRQVLHAGTACAVHVTYPDGEKVLVPARVVRCRHVEGALHEVGVQFDKPIKLPDVL